MASVLGDIRFGVRQLVRNGSFTAAALLSLALGIGANSALFGMFNSLLWAPLPVESPDRLVVVYSKRDSQSFYQRFSYPEYRDYRDQNEVFDGLVGYAPVDFSFKAEGREAARAYGELVTGNYFDVLGVRMHLGRGFLPEEDRTPGTHPVVVVSHKVWERRLGADPSVIGRTVTLSSQAFTVVGVAPPGFKGTYAPFFAPDLWVPTMTLGSALPGRADALGERDTRILRMMGRLKPGVTVAQAETAVSTIAGRLAQTYPDTNRGVTALAFRELDTRPEVEIAPAANAVALVFLGLTALVLLVACANVANLLLARAAARQRELALRLAIGAGRVHLVRQLLVESLLLALTAGGLGVLLGTVAMRLLSSYRVPTDIPIEVTFRTDWRAVAFTLALSVLAALAFGLAPALRASRVDLVPALKGEESALAGRRTWTPTNLLVIAQVATAVVLLVAAGLFVRSVGGARTLDPGFEVGDRAVMSFDTSLQRYDRDRADIFYRRLADDLRALPMVASATLASAVPLDFDVNVGDVVIEGRPAAPGRETEQVMYSVVDDRYAATLGTRLVRGRWPGAQDTAESPRVAVVNETMAEQCWPGLDPLGRRFRFGENGEGWIEVVGVVADGKYRQLTETARPYLFVPSSQHFRHGRTLVVKMQPGADLGSTLAGIRGVVQAIDPAMPIFDAKTMDQFMERAYLGPKLAAMLIGPAGFLALVIAAVGLYGVMAYWVSRRTRELGIRTAVGARPADVFRFVMGQGLRLVSVGIVLGVTVALGASRLIANLLFGVSPNDPLVLVGVPLLLVAVSVVAVLVPARRALAIDPLVALRTE